jgi:hypothetical protein
MILTKKQNPQETPTTMLTIASTILTTAKSLTTTEGIVILSGK